MTKSTKKPPAKRRFSQDFSGESKTQQHFSDSADVNNIVASYRATGLDPYAERLKLKRFGYASSQTFSEAMRNVAEIQTSFQELPSNIRQDFQNDPGRWIDSLTTPITPDEPIVAQEASQAPPDPPIPASAPVEIDAENQ